MQPFDRDDYMAFCGAEGFKDGTQPHIGEMHLRAGTAKVPTPHTVIVGGEEPSVSVMGDGERVEDGGDGFVEMVLRLPGATPALAILIGTALEQRCMLERGQWLGIDGLESLGFVGVA